MKRHVRWLAVASLAVCSAVPALAAPPDLAKLLDQSDLEYEVGERGRIKLVYSFDDGRSQVIFLQPQDPFEGVPVVEIYSPVMSVEGGTVPAALARRLLEANGMRKLTYFGIEDVEGTPFVFCYHNTPTEGLTAKTLSTLLLGVATFADEMEKEQLGAMSDEY